MISFDVSGLARLTAAMSASPTLVAKQGRAFITESAAELRDQWRDNATITAGVHGKHYPKSIDFRVSGFVGVEAEIGPLSGPQSNMSFEFGSSNQPPHLDGQRALEKVEPSMLRRFNALKVL